MSERDLAALQAELMALPAEEVSEPRLPMAVALQEGNDLLTFVRNADVLARLGAVGFEVKGVERLAQAVGAARAAQSQWTVTRDRTKSDAQQEREQRGLSLRSDLFAAARFNLRDDRVAQATLGHISEGDGIADLIQDLNDLGELIERNLAAFERDQTINAPEAVEQARSLSSDLAAGTSSERLTVDQATAKALRDRAYSYLDDLIGEVREAGRYAFRKDPQILKRFSSAYRRRQRNAAASREEAPTAARTATPGTTSAQPPASPAGDDAPLG